MASRAPLDWEQPVVPAGLAPAQRAPAATGFGENFGATFHEMLIAGNTNASDCNLTDAYRPVLEALDRAGAGYQGRTARGPMRLHYLNPGQLGEDPLLNPYVDVPGRRQMTGMIWEEVRRQRARDPHFLEGLPDNAEAFERQANARVRQQLAGDQDIQRRATGWGRVGGFAGGVAGSFVDPVNIATLPIGGEARTVLGQLAHAFIVNATVEALSQPAVRQNYAELGEDISVPDSLRMILYAGTLGAGVHGAIRGTGFALGHAGTGYDRMAEHLFNAMPEAVQRRWADSMTVDGHLLTDTLRVAVPEEHWTPDLRAAVNVAEREAELHAASPYVPDAAGGAAHVEGLRRARAQAEGRPPAEDRPSDVPRVAPAPAAAAPPVERQWHAIVGNEGGTGRHGEFLTSPAGAIGPAQVMPGTAPYAARLAGLPWDEARYRGDRDYNLSLGRAYYDEMLRQFGGDPSLAAAAYNAGPGSVAGRRGVRWALERARRAGEPDNWEAYLPAETRRYVTDFRRRLQLPDSRAPMREAAAEPGDGGAAAAELADAEALAASREAERQSEVPSGSGGRADGEAEVPFEPVPMLRRELFGSEAEWAEAQAETWRRFNGEGEGEISPPRAGNGAPARESEAGGAGQPAPEMAAERPVFVDDHGKPIEVVGELPFEGVAPALIASDGRLYVGGMGEAHFNVIEQYEAKGLTWTGGSGFVTPDGRYLDRVEALAHVNANDERIRPSANMRGEPGGDELDALDYRDQSAFAPPPSYSRHRAEWERRAALRRAAAEPVAARGGGPAIGPTDALELAEGADLELGAPALKAYDDPIGGAGVKAQAASLEHDLRLDAGEETPPPTRAGPPDSPALQSLLRDWEHAREAGLKAGPVWAVRNREDGSFATWNVKKGASEEWVQAQWEPDSFEVVKVRPEDFPRPATEGAPRREHGIPAAASRPIATFVHKQGEKRSYFKPVMQHRLFRAAKAGDEAAARDLVRELVAPAQLEQAAAELGGARFVPVIAAEAAGHNAIPLELARRYARAAGGEVDLSIVQAVRAAHTGASAAERMLSRPLFEGAVEKGRAYVIVDDVGVMGGTVAALADHIQREGGTVRRVVLLASGAEELAPTAKQLRSLEENGLGDVAREEFGIEPGALTRAEATWLTAFRSPERLRAYLAEKGYGREGDPLQPGRSGGAGEPDPAAGSDAPDRVGDNLAAYAAEAQSYRVSEDGEEKTAAQLLEEIERDRAAAAAIRGCIQ